MVTSRLCASSTVKELFCEIWNIWPPSPSTCNPLDYFMSSAFLLHVTLAPYNTGGFLKQKTVELVVSLDKYTMTTACFGFLAWVEKVVVADGNFIK